ncbi:MAG: restriction endonuclease [Verrucomicrobiota bacterium]
MAVPTYDTLMRPILVRATKEAITRRSMNEAMVEEFQLTDEERAELLPSGSSTFIANRVGWAMTFLTKAGLIKKVEKFTYRATEAAGPFLMKYPNGFSDKDLKSIHGYEAAWEKKAAKDPKQESTTTSTATPEDLIGNAINQLSDSLRTELLEQLSAVDPFRFEQIVIDLLFGMGYGGSREEAAKVTKKSGDEGIDGIINEDRLGLDVIYVQAKRWKSTVGRPDVQGFVGALAGKQAQKGVFITTSNFTGDAIQFARGLSQKVILIDGVRLADLMIEHNIGVSTTRTIALKRIDTDYFEEN